MSNYVINEELVNKIVLLLLEQQNESIISDLINEGVSTDIQIKNIPLITKVIDYKDYKTLKFLIQNDFHNQKKNLHNTLITEIDSFLGSLNRSIPPNKLDFKGKIPDVLKIIYNEKAILESQEFRDIALILEAIFNENIVSPQIEDKTFTSEPFPNLLEIRILFSMLNEDYSQFDSLLNGATDISKRIYSGSTLAHFSSMINNNYFLQKLCRLNLDFFYKSRNLERAVYNLIRNDNVEIIQLFENDIKDNEVLLIELINTSIEIKAFKVSSYLINNFDCINLINDNQVLNNTLLYKSFEFLKLIIDSGANLNLKDKKNRPLIFIPIEQNEIETAKYMIESGLNLEIVDDEGMTALLYASKFNNSSLVRLLIRNGAQINKYDINGYGAITWAIKNKNINLFSYLLNNNVEIDTKDKMGWTPLIWAVRTKNNSMAQTLLQSGHDLNELDFWKWSALDWAIHESNNSIIRLLLNLGASPEKKDINGRTPIFSAISSGNITALNLLIRYGVDLNVIDNNGISPLALAIYNNEHQMIKLLKSFGATSEAEIDKLDFENSITQIINNLRSF